MWLLSGVFLKEKPARALASLVRKDRVWYASMLCKEIDCTYPHMVNTLATFQAAGLIKTEGSGRIKIIRLTNRGEDLAQEIDNLLRRFERLDDGSIEKTVAVEVAKPEPRKKKEKTSAE
jgi:DNA-binding MarR family transcriptional regulator